MSQYFVLLVFPEVSSWPVVGEVQCRPSCAPAQGGWLSSPGKPVTRSGHDLQLARSSAGLPVHQLREADCPHKGSLLPGQVMTCSWRGPVQAFLCTSSGRLTVLTREACYQVRSWPAVGEVQCRPSSPRLASLSGHSSNRRGARAKNQKCQNLWPLRSIYGRLCFDISRFVMTLYATSRCASVRRSRIFE